MGENFLGSPQLHDATHQPTPTKMKLTLDIDDNHAPALIQLLATLLTKSSPVEGNEDPAPGHPELPLQDTDEADLRWGVAGELDETADPTLRDLPFPEVVVCPELPPLPEGKTRWVYRGRFEGMIIPAGERIVAYNKNDSWIETSSFSNRLDHIEAV